MSTATIKKNSIAAGRCAWQPSIRFGLDGPVLYEFDKGGINVRDHADDSRIPSDVSPRPAVVRPAKRMRNQSPVMESVGLAWDGEPNSQSEPDFMAVDQESRNSLAPGKHVQSSLISLSLRGCSRCIRRECRTAG